MRDNHGFDLWADDYDKDVSFSYNCNAYPFAGYKEVLEDIFCMITLKPNAVVLDLGFGTGLLTSRLYQSGCTVFGQDYSQNMVDIASAKMPAARLFLGDFSLGLAEPLLHNRYDFIISTYSLHHLPDNRKLSLLSVLLDLLNPGGKIIIGDIAFENRIQMEKARNEIGSAWDDDEFYFAVDELEFHGLNFIPKSFCAGVICIPKP